MKRLAIIALLLSACLPCRADEFFAALRATRTRAAATYPQNNPNYSDAYAWWIFASDADPQPDVGPLAEMDWYEAAWYGDPAWTNAGGGSINFDGNDGLYIATNNWLSAATNGTLNAWIYPTANADYQSVFSSSAESRNDRYFIFARYISGGTPRMLVATRNASSTDWRRTPAGSITDVDTWYMVTLTSNGTAWQIYINGIIQTLESATGSNNGNWLGDIDSRQNISIGFRRQTVDQWQFTGHISDNAIFSTTFTSNQVYQLYLDTKDTYE